MHLPTNKASNYEGTIPGYVNRPVAAGLLTKDRPRLDENAGKLRAGHGRAEHCWQQTTTRAGVAATPRKLALMVTQKVASSLLCAVS